ncbi:MAG: lipoyl synthase [Zoogloeaceae bacterium]|jgi:lipoic acid synthetase|nr:lipoyl synthase [Zoogloeaceae bacterium]
MTKTKRGEKQKGAAKIAGLPVKTKALLLEGGDAPRPQKPIWIRARAGGARFEEMRGLLRKETLRTVCEEASCPNIGECFERGAATFMILGDCCTRRCPFCDVGHGLPLPPDAAEPERVAEIAARLNLRYAVITSVDRDDLRDGGAAHFAAVLRALRARNAEMKVEILVPDFRGRMETALSILADAPPDVFNHNLETVPRLYPLARPGADYRHSLALLREFSARRPDVPTKSGLMAGLGETDAEIEEVLRDLRAHGVTRLTIGQYLAPSARHLPVRRYVPPETFREYERAARALGFSAVAAAPLVRSSYWAEKQDETARA